VVGLAARVGSSLVMRNEKKEEAEEEERCETQINKMSKREARATDEEQPDPKIAKTMAARKCFVGGNWKCNGTRSEVKQLVEMLNGFGEIPKNVDVVVAPPAIHIGSVLDGLRSDIKVAIQNSWSEPKAGAWTGEVTPDLIVDFGLEWVVLGHSERRAYCGESEEIVGKKVKLALEAGLNVIACIGEQLEDRESNNTMKVCEAQLAPILDAIPSKNLSNVVIAYEPVWAIGTGVTASPEQAQDTQKSIREYLATKIGESGANNMRIIYGGSVKGANCEDLIRKPDIDGFLVGGASLKKEFETIINSSSLKAKI